MRSLSKLFTCRIALKFVNTLGKPAATKLSQIIPSMFLLHKINKLILLCVQVPCLLNNCDWICKTIRNGTITAALKYYPDTVTI